MDEKLPRLRDKPCSLYDRNNVFEMDIDHMLIRDGKIIWLVEYSKRSTLLYSPLIGFIEYTIKTPRKRYQLSIIKYMATKLGCGALLIIYDDSLSKFGIYDILLERSMDMDLNDLTTYLDTR